MKVSCQFIIDESKDATFYRVEHPVTQELLGQIESSKRTYYRDEFLFNDPYLAINKPALFLALMQELLYMRHDAPEWSDYEKELPA